MPEDLVARATAAGVEKQVARLIQQINQIQNFILSTSDVRFVNKALMLAADPTTFQTAITLNNEPGDGQIMQFIYLAEDATDYTIDGNRYVQTTYPGRADVFYRLSPD